MADVIYLTKTRAFLNMSELHFLLERRRQHWDHVLLKSKSVVICSDFYNVINLQHFCWYLLLLLVPSPPLCSACITIWKAS